MRTHEQLVEELMKRPGVKAEVERLELEEGTLLDKQIQVHQVISNSNETAKIVALRDAAKIGTDAIKRGEFTVLENKQDIANLVRTASERTNSKA